MSSPYQQITEYIDQHLKADISEEKIRDHLAKHGWAEAHIDAAFDEHHKKNAVVSPARNVELSESSQQTKQPEKYTLTQVVSDISHAIIFNKVAYLASISIIVVAFIIGVALVGPLALATGINIATVIFLLIISPLLISIVQTFMYSVMNVLLYAFHQNKRLQPLEPLIDSTKKLRRITLTNLLWNAITYFPVIVSILIAFLTFSASTYLLIPILILICLIWILIIGLRYSLSPAIAQYEPQVAIQATMRRSQKLLGTRGQWLIVAGYIVVVIIQTLISTIDSSNVIVALIQMAAIIVVTTYAFGGLSAIYFNRAAVKNNYRS